MYVTTNERGYHNYPDEHNIVDWVCREILLAEEFKKSYTDVVSYIYHGQGD